MQTWIGFLRAINVGKRKYLMADLRAAMSAAGFTDVETHIQTGNVRFSTPLTDREEVSAQVESVLLADRGFEVPVVLLTPEELRSLAVEGLGLSADLEPDAHYIAVAAAEVGPEACAELGNDHEHLIVSSRAVHWLLSDRAFHESKISLPKLEKAIGTATVRNLKVIYALSEKWGR